MGKHRRSRAARKESRPVGAKGALRSLVEVVVGAKESLLDLGIDTGLQVLQALLEQDRTDPSALARKDPPSLARRDPT